MGNDPPQVLLSGFCDEAAPDKTLDQQFSVMAALGVAYVSVRFVDLGHGIKNVLELTDQEIATVGSRLRDFGLGVCSIGSPIGKVKIVDVEDGSQNRYVDFDRYLSGEVQMACRIANALDAKLVRGFSFYHPQYQDAEAYVSQAIDRIGRIAEVCDAHGLTFGLEVETNLIGNTGDMLGRIHQALNSPALVLVFDGGNLVSQGFSTPEVLRQFRVMLDGLGWLHVKDYLPVDRHGHDRPGDSAAGHLDEESLQRYVPADRGATDYLAIFRELRTHLPKILQRNRARDIAGFFVELEPHLRGGGQFGGYSGPDGMGVGLRSLCQVLDQSSIRYHLTEFGDL